MMSKIPILRLLIPFCVGIFLYSVFPSSSVVAPVVLALLSACVYLFLFFSTKNPQSRFHYRSFFFFPIFFFAVALGWFCATVATPQQINLQQVNGKQVICRIDDVDARDFSMSLLVQLSHYGKQGSAHALNGKVLITTRGCNYCLKPGDMIALRANFEQIRNQHNPDEFDYAGYMRRQGVIYTQHLAVDQIVKIGENATFFNQMTNYRNYIQNQIFDTSLDSEAQHLLIAIMLGNKKFIDENLRHRFAAAGIAHVLALSGLHVGIIALLMWCLLAFLDYLGLKKIRLALTLLTIVAFDVFTGLSASVIRATVMISFVFIAKIFYRKTSPMNALFVAAFLILLFAPDSIFDVGFQLSFVSVFALLWLYPHELHGKFERSRILKYAVSTVFVSFISMLATIALTAHYFHSVSLASAVSNLFILPVFPLLMILGTVLVALCCFSLHLPALEWLINWLYDYIDSITLSISNMSLSHIDGIYVDTVELLLFYVVLVLLMSAYRLFTVKYCIYAGFMAFVLLAYHSMSILSSPTVGLVIFNSFDSTPIFYYEGNKGYLWIPDNQDVETKDFERYSAAFLAHRQIDTVLCVNDRMQLSTAFIKTPYAFLNKERLMVAGGGNWKKLETNAKVAVDLLLVTKQFHGRIADLNRLFDYDMLLISGGMYKPEMQRLAHECDSLMVKYRLMTKTGAYMK